jgi:hypothetical protein
MNMSKAVALHAWVRIPLDSNIFLLLFFLVNVFACKHCRRSDLLNVCFFSKMISYFISQYLISYKKGFKIHVSTFFSMRWLLKNDFRQWWAAKFLTRGSHPQKKKSKLIFSYFKFFFNTNHSKLHSIFHLALFLLYFSLITYLLLITSKITVKTALHTRVDWTWLFSGIKSSLGSQKLGLSSSKPIPKYFCILFRLTFVVKPSKINQSVWKCERFWKKIIKNSYCLQLSEIFMLTESNVVVVNEK